MKIRKQILAAAILCVVSCLAWLGLNEYYEPPAPLRVFPAISYGELMALARTGKLASVALSGQVAQAVTTDGKVTVAAIPEDTHPADALVMAGVDVRAVPRQRPSTLVSLTPWIPTLLMFAIIGWSMASSGGRGGMRAFGRSRARRLVPGSGRITFDDLAGIDGAKADLTEVVDYLRRPETFTGLGGRIPRGILLIGPPGTGKTLLAKAVAGEAGVPFFTVSGSDFVEMFVGVGASRVRDTFKTARKNAPCIVFVDEIDAMGRSRGAPAVGSDEREQTLNQMLVEMDGVADASDVILIAATNRPDVLDPALLRPGRFDRQVVVPNPDLAGRADILRVHMRKISISPAVDQAALAKTLARGTPGFSGADLANLVNEAALCAARGKATTVAAEDFETARDRQLLGAERRTLAMTDEERSLTAYHEAGHALCAVREPSSDPVHKATIVPRGRALGLVVRLPETDRLSLSLERIEADLTVAMGGRAAEMAVFGERKVTTGAQGDIVTATLLARQMVTSWGYSEKLGAVHYPGDGESAFLGRVPGSAGGVISDETARIIDEEVRRIIDAAKARAMALLKRDMDVLHALAAALIERETLSGDEIRRIAGAAPGEMPNV